MPTLTKQPLSGELMESAEIVPMTSEMAEELLDWYEERSGWDASCELRSEYNETLAAAAPRGSWRPRRKG